MASEVLKEGYVSWQLDVLILVLVEDGFRALRASEYTNSPMVS